MKENPTLQALDEKILRLKQQLLALGPLHPGSLSQQLQVCGKPGCKCRDPQTPQPHGPYTKLTYAFHGKFNCRFVRADAVGEVTALLAAYKTFRQLTDDDELCAQVVEHLACDAVVPVGQLERRYGVDFRRRFAPALAQLKPLLEERLVSLDAERLRVASPGRLLLGHIASLFSQK